MVILFSYHGAVCHKGDHRRWWMPYGHACLQAFVSAVPVGGQLGYNTTRSYQCQYTFFTFLLSFFMFANYAGRLVFSAFLCNYILW